MESKVNYTIVGFFVIILTCVIIVMGLWLTQSLERKPYTTYLTYMDESVAGLSEQSPVKYNGVDVGYVSNLRLNLKNPQEVIIEMKIHPFVPITKSTEAVLMQQGLTGIAYVGLRGGHPGEPRLRPGPNQQYPVIKSAPSFMVRLDQTLNSLSKNITSLTKNVKQLLNKENLASVQHTLKNLDTITTTLADNRKQIDQSIKSLDVFLKNGAKASKELPQLISQLHKGAQSLDTMAKNISSTTQSLKKTANKGELTINAFNDQVIPQAHQTLQTINQMAGNIRDLSRELKQQPSILIGGKRSNKPGPGEK